MDKNDENKLEPDEETFSSLYEAFLPRIYAYIAYRVSTIEEAEDLTSQIFLKVIEKFHLFKDRGEGSLQAWLFRIAHNCYVDHYRVTSKHSEVALEDFKDYENADALPEQQVIKDESSAMMQGLLRSLPDRQREIVGLKFYGYLRNIEIAGILGIDERTVASTLMRALRGLHKRMTEEDPSETSERHN